MNMIDAIIVDDEDHCVERLERLLTTHCSSKVRLLGSYTSADAAEAGINTLKPRLIFLDIQLRDRTGFDLLQKIKPEHCSVVFTTGFGEYAIAAFRFSAVDYLLKPIDKDELIASVDKAINSISALEATRKYEVLLHNLESESPTSNKICLPSTSGFEFVDIENIVRCQSNGNYTMFFLATGEKIMVARTLKEFDSLLSHHGFFRVHHSHLVNLTYIKRYNKGSGGYVVLSDNSEIEVSSRRKEAFLARVMRIL